MMAIGVKENAFGVGGDFVIQRRGRDARATAGETPALPSTTQGQLPATSLLADGGVSQAVFAIKDDFAGDQTVVVDASGGSVPGSGIGDFLEDSVFVEKPEAEIGIEIVAHHGTGII